MHILKSTVLVATTAAVIGGGMIAAPAQASSVYDGYDCVSHGEDATLKLGWTPRQVQQYVNANPWLGQSVRSKGHRYYAQAFYNCNYSSDRDFVAVYRVRADGTRHLYAHKIMKV